jgi:hypothetical protein
MPRLDLKATELTNTDVDFVAFVKHGANRIPFRITKSEDEPMDLYSLGRRFLNKADLVPTVVAIISKSEVAPEVLKVLLPGALKKSEQDGMFTFVAEGAKSEGGVLVKLDESLAVIITNSNLRKAFPASESVNGFGAARAEHDFLVADAIAKAETPALARDAIAKAGEAFAAHVELLAAVLPANIFKAEQLLKIGSGNAEGAAGTNQETGDGLGDKANGKANGKAKKSSDGKTLSDEGDPGAKDPLMPGADAGKGPQRAAKADAGKNGTGAGVELGAGTGTNPNATDDDEDEEINAAPGERVSGDNSGLPAKVNAKKAAIAAAMLALTKATEMEDDDSTNGAQSDVPAKVKAPTTKDANLAEVRTVGASGEGARQAAADSKLDHRDTVTDEVGADGLSKPKGATLSTEGVPAKLLAPTTKNDGDADIGKDGKGKTLPEAQSGAGAQEKDVQTLKSETAIMVAIQALAKSVQESVAGVTKSVSDLSVRVDEVTGMAKKTDAALNGTVFAESGDDRQTWAKTTKSDGAPPLLDTGYGRRRTA